MRSSESRTARIPIIPISTPYAGAGGHTRSMPAENELFRETNHFFGTFCNELRAWGLYSIECTQGRITP
jgi:hypothetical protein